MSRNKDRLGGHTPEPAETPQQPVEKAFDPLSFVAPTEFVDLPSKETIRKHIHFMDKKLLR